MPLCSGRVPKDSTLVIFSMKDGTPGRTLMIFLRKNKLGTPRFRLVICRGKISLWTPGFDTWFVDEGINWRNPVSTSDSSTKEKFVDPRFRHMICRRRKFLGTPKCDASYFNEGKVLGPQVLTRDMSTMKKVWEPRSWHVMSRRRKNWGPSGQSRKHYFLHDFGLSVLIIWIDLLARKIRIYWLWRMNVPRLNLKMLSRKSIFNSSLKQAANNIMSLFNPLQQHWNRHYAFLTLLSFCDFICQRKEQWFVNNMLYLRLWRPFGWISKSNLI